MRVWILSAVIAAMLMASGCGGDGGGGGGDSGPIKIGVVVPQSGPASVLGKAYADAAKLRAQELNEQGGILGRQIELVIRDTQSDQTQALTAVKELDGEGVAAIVGPGTSPTTLAAMSAIQSSGLPTVSMGSANAIVEPPSERQNVFKTPPNGDTAAQAILDHMKENGIETVGLISVNNPYGDDGVKAWEQLDEEGEVELIASEKFEEEDSDVTPQLQNLLAENPDAIVVWAIPPGAPTVRRNYVENIGNVQTPMYFDTGAGAELFLELAGPSANGALVAQPKSLVWDQVESGDPSYEVLQEFGKAYEKAYGEVSGFSGYSWDALGLLKAAMEEADSTDPSAVSNALEEMGEQIGVSGSLEFTPEDHEALSAEDIVILEVRNGDWVLTR